MTGGEPSWRAPCIYLYPQKTLRQFVITLYLLQSRSEKDGMSQSNPLFLDANSKPVSFPNNTSSTMLTDAQIMFSASILCTSIAGAIYVFFIFNLKFIICSDISSRS